MSFADSARSRVERFSERVGRDPALIQGAGGNVSWKDEGTLWVKASGAWLSRALEEDMFVPVDLEGVRAMVADGHENYIAHRRGSSLLRPSIETALHALMPQRVVAHLHAIEAITHAVRTDGRDRLGGLLSKYSWLWIPYRKPGAALASTIAFELATLPNPPDVLVLQNHGIVFCGDDVDVLEASSKEVLDRLRSDARTSVAPSTSPVQSKIEGYRLAGNGVAQTLALDPVSFALARDRWVIYPDHAVFLGPEARLFDTVDEARATLAGEAAADQVVRPCVIVGGVGVWLSNEASSAAAAMLDCYAEVCLRLPSTDVVKALTDAEVAALLNWEAEKFRQRLSQ